jgi:hypothetical protein
MARPAAARAMDSPRLHARIPTRRSHVATAAALRARQRLPRAAMAPAYAPPPSFNLVALFPAVPARAKATARVTLIAAAVTFAAAASACRRRPAGVLAAARINAATDFASTVGAATSPALANAKPAMSRAAKASVSRPREHRTVRARPARAITRVAAAAATDSPQPAAAFQPTRAAHRAAPTPWPPWRRAATAPENAPRRNNKTAALSSAAPPHASATARSTAIARRLISAPPACALHKKR